MYNSNLPEVKLGIVAVSRNCFPKELSYTRCKAVVDEYEIGRASCRERV